jgi:hypothetical protein
LRQAAQKDPRATITLAQAGANLPRSANHEQLASDIAYLFDPRSSQQQVGQALVRIILFCAHRGVGFGPDGKGASPQVILKASPGS